MVEVHLYGRFKKLLGNLSAMEEAITFLPVEEGDTIADVLRRLGIEREDVSHLFLNAEYSGLRRKIKPGDRLGIFPKEMGLLYRQYFPKIEE
ncbi:MAG: MoaD/ThiS family protein [Armatimonadota bacterium]|nr:MoaD/ThiS family protein [Armatimonadota bacterium]MDR5703107.1 MoaD/ThiS family protein [Armatimonadota bacterium]MDR7434983.1 MoaD/ThiS family protein [Armatimonadota bacterium]